MRALDRPGIHLEPVDDRSAAVDALAARMGGRVGIAGVLAALGRRARPSRAGRLLGRAVTEAYSWDAADSRDPRWWPQGISGSADASATEEVAGRRLLVTTSYAKDLGRGSHGCRLTVVDLATLRYEHVLLVVPRLDEEGAPTLEPVRVHAGGLAWLGPHLHLAATGRGLLTAGADDVLAVTDPGPSDRLRIDDDRSTAYGHRFVLPVRRTLRAGQDDGHAPMRYSFLGLDRSEAEPALVAGEYARGGGSRRLVRYAVDPETSLPRLGSDGLARPVAWWEGVPQMQGVVVRGGEHLVTVSKGRFLPGTVYAGPPDALRARRLAVPMGPEDLTYWPSTDRVWSLTEHPRRRWFFSMRRDWF